MRALSPKLPTTSVGSFPKPENLLKARALFPKGKISAQELNKIEREATEFWIRTQEELDYDLLVDGEMYRGDMATYFAENVKGCVISEPVRSYGNRYYKKPIIVGPIERSGSVTVDWFQFAQSLTSRPLIGMLTGPYTMMDWSFNEYYPSRRRAAEAWAEVIRLEAQELEAAGAQFIQIDEPAISARVDELNLAIDTMGRVVDGLKSKTITHICYGTFGKIYPKILEIPVDRLDLEFSNSQLNFLDSLRKYPFTKEVGFGVVDVHTHVIEDKQTVVARIRQILEVIPPERVYVDPDCGLKTRTVEEAIAKLRVIAEAVKEVRATI